MFQGTKRYTPPVARSTGHARTERFAAWLDQARVIVLLLSVVVAGLCALVATNLQVKSDLTNLLPSAQQSVKDLTIVRDRARPFGTMQIVVQSPNDLAHIAFGKTGDRRQIALAEALPWPIQQRPGNARAPRRKRRCGPTAGLRGLPSFDAHEQLVGVDGRVTGEVEPRDAERTTRRRARLVHEGHGHERRRVQGASTLPTALCCILEAREACVCSILNDEPTVRRAYDGVGPDLLRARKMKLGGGAKNLGQRRRELGGGYG